MERRVYLCVEMNIGSGSVYKADSLPNDAIKHPHNKTKLCMETAIKQKKKRIPTLMLKEGTI